MTSSEAWELVEAHERSASSEQRTARGAWYTPRAVVAGVTALAIDATWQPSLVDDPTCGAGAFLLGALDRLVELGCEPIDALSRVCGTDIDAGAVDACRAVLSSWGQAHGVPETSIDEARARVSVADALDRDVSERRTFGGTGSAAGPALVIGNPPFATPLRGRTLPSSAVAYREARREWFGPYADLAALHLGAALEQRRSGDRLAMVLPQSVISSRDLGGLRSHLDEQAPVVGAWAADSLVFDANVRVWAPVLEVGSDPDALSIVHHESGLERRTESAPWRLLVADALGGPVVRLEGEPLGHHVVATAGFRDEYYGLAAACEDLEQDDGRHDLLRIATVGSLDPLWSWWGRRETTFAKQRWDRPVVDPDALDGRVARWAQQQRRPKLLLPTQSKIFEPVIDRNGSLVPVTPVVAMWPTDNHSPSLDHLAAMLLAPPLVAWARRNWFGAAMSNSAIKVPAAGISELPMPDDRSVWDQAAAMLADAAQPKESAGLTAEQTSELVGNVGELMNSAYWHRADEADLLAWWRDRAGLTC